MPDIKQEEIPPKPSSQPTLDTPDQLPKVKFPPFFWKESQNIISQIEGKTNTKVLVYYMHPDASISGDDVDYFYSHVKELQSDKPISLILVSNGGSSMAAWRIANVLRKYCSQLTVIVPSRCASAATMLSLSADKILFGPAGYLTAIDTSLNHPLNPKPSDQAKPSSVSVDQINRIKRMISEDLKNHPSSKSMSEILFEKIHPIVLGELERSGNLSELVAKNMLGLRNDKPDETEKLRIASILNDGYPAHGYPIVFKEAQQIGLPVEELSDEINRLSWELIKLYSLVSKEIITNINPEFYHTEGVPVLIESLGIRTFYRISYDKRFKSPMGWMQENSKSGWLSSTTNPVDPDKPKFSEIEL